MNLPISIELLQSIQAMINIFIWNYKTMTINAQIMYQKVQKGVWQSQTSWIILKPLN